MKNLKVEIELTEGQKQEAIGKLVHNEILCCMSMVVQELYSKSENEELYEILERGEQVATCDNCNHEYPDITNIDNKFGSCSQPKCNGTLYFEEHIHEALEHWAVSDWMADKLLEQGEMVIKDYLGLNIWGRTTSGQMILADYCIIKVWESIQ